MLPIFILFLLFQCSHSYQQPYKKKLTPSEVLDKILSDKNIEIDIDKTVEALLSLKKPTNETEKCADDVKCMTDRILIELSERQERAKEEERRKNQKWWDENKEKREQEQMLRNTTMVMLGLVLMTLLIVFCVGAIKEQRKKAHLKLTDELEAATSLASENS